MQSPDKIIKTYNTTADDYTTAPVHDLFKKHFDLLLLKEFALINKNKGRCADFGCGPGQTTKFLYDHGLTDITGIDISTGMIEKAQSLYHNVKFEIGDLLDLSHEPGYFACGTAFYAIVHFSYDQVKQAFFEINKVLQKGGQFLFSFHVGTETVHYDMVNDKEVDIDLYFFETEKISDLLQQTGFGIIDVLERHPYKDTEYPSKRGYIWAEKN